MNTVPFKKKADIPFYSWDCITLQLFNRDVDLIIRKESQMLMLIKFICYKINTCDGKKDSAAPFKNELLKNCLLECSY